MFKNLMLESSINYIYPSLRDAYTKLLGSGDLKEKYSSQFNTDDLEMAVILAKICFYAHFTGE